MRRKQKANALKRLKEILKEDGLESRPVEESVAYTTLPSRIVFGRSSGSKRQLMEYEAKMKIQESRDRRSRGRRRVKVSPKLSVPEREWDEVMEFASLLSAKYNRYCQNSHKTYSFHLSLKPDTRSYGMLKRAINEMKSLDVEPEVYIEAQFYWFDKWFGREPKFWELSGGAGKMPAKKRVTVYQAIQEEMDGELASIIGENSTLISTNALTQGEILKYNQRLLKRMMSDGSTKEGCFLEFAQDGMGLFDSVYLRQSKTYRRLKKEGKL